MSEILSFAIENIELMEEENNSQFATLKIDAFASGRNRHDLYVSDDTLKKTASTILQKPIVWEYSRITDDASTHSENQIICGFIPHDSPIEFRELPDGRTMMSVIGKLWTRYSGKMMEIFERDKNKSVSVEMTVFEEGENQEFKMPEILSYCYMAITVLGQLVRPAIPLAKAELVAFAAKEKEDYKVALLEFSNKYAGIDLTIPKEIRSNANKGLELYRSLGIGGTSVSLAVARHISKNEVVAMDKIKAIHKFLNSRKGVPKNKNQPDAEYISFLLHGGSQALEWSKNIVTAINEIDSKQLSYFEEKEELSVDEKEKVVEKKEEEMAVETPEVEEPKKEEMAEEKPEEEKKEESPAEEKKEKEKEKEENPEAEKKEMSLDANLDMAAFVALLAEETEAYTALVAKHKEGVELDHAVVYGMAYQKMCKMAEDLKKAEEDRDAYMAAGEELKKFKADVEARQFAFEIETTLSEVSEVLSKDDVNQARENSKNYSLENVGAWKNEVKAMAFSANKDSKKPDDGITRFATSWVDKKQERKLDNGWV